MTAQLISGHSLAETIKDRVLQEATSLASLGRTPRLVAVQVGENAASKIYTNMQAISCTSVGIEYQLLSLPGDIIQDNLIAEIRSLNDNDSVSGIILQMPLPPQIDARVAQIAIDPRKDVEGIHPHNIGQLVYGHHLVAPCTAEAAVELLLQTLDDLAGQELVIVGHSEIVGKPIAMMMLQSHHASPTITVCHVATKDLAFHTSRADIVIVATGVRQHRWQKYRLLRETDKNATLPDLSPLITADMLKENAIVIDVAINRIPQGFDNEGEPLKNDRGRTAIMTTGDVDFDAACEKVAAITPVPGGVGPVTVAMLLKNTIACAKSKA